MGCARHHDVAVRGNGHRPTHVVAGTDGHRDLAVRVERRVQGAGAGEAHHGHVVVRAVVGDAGHDDVAIGSDGHGVAVVGSGAHGYEHLAVGVKCRVQKAGAGQAGDREVEVGTVGAVPARHDVAVRGNGKTRRVIGAEPEPNSHYAIGSKSGIKRAGRRQSDNCEVKAHAKTVSRARPSNDDLPIRLNGNRMANVIFRVDIYDNFAIRGERGIQLSRCRVSEYRDVVI